MKWFTFRAIRSLLSKLRSIWTLFLPQRLITMLCFIPFDKFRVVLRYLHQKEGGKQKTQEGRNYVCLVPDIFEDGKCILWLGFEG